MTNRTTIDDNRVTLTTSCGYTKAGSYFRKVQVGTDYPSSYTRYEKIPYSGDFTDTRVKQAIAFTEYISRKKKPAKRFFTEPHNYSTSGSRFIDPLFEWTSDYAPGQLKTGTMGSCFGTPSFQDNWTTNDYIALCGKLRETIAGSDFHAGNFVAQGHQALEMIANSATRIYSAYKSVRRGNIEKAARQLTNTSYKGRKIPNQSRHDVANNWLELQYGWLPLLQDAHTGAQALGKIMGSPMQQTYSAQMRKEATLTGVYPNVSWGSTKGFTRYRIKARVREVNVPQLIGLQDPLGIAWEVMPFSFVADWFIPISGFLEARNLNSSVTAVYIHSKLYRTVAQGAVLKNGYHGSSGYREEYFKFDRLISTDLQIPLPTFKPPSSVPSWKRAANALALVSQLFK